MEDFETVQKPNPTTQLEMNALFKHIKISQSTKFRDFLKNNPVV